MRSECNDNLCSQTVTYINFPKSNFNVYYDEMDGVNPVSGSY